MSALQQVQQVAKKLEGMLETALGQLKAEQKKRKEGEARLVELEMDVVNKEHTIKTLENRLEEMTKDKDEKISSLEASINFLQSVIIEKEQEILRLQELTEEIEAADDDSASNNMSNTVEKFEKTLNKLLENSANKDDDGSDNGEIVIDGPAVEETHEVFVEGESLDNEEEFHGFPNQEESSEEYILDESMEELQNEEDQIVEITADAVDFKDEEMSETKDFKDESKVFTTPQSAKKGGKTCHVCNTTFKTKGKLAEHQSKEGHLPKLECEECGKYFKTKGTLVQHKARIHSDVMPYKCSKCDKRFKDQGSCRRHEANDSVHIRNENIKQNPSLLCNICGKEFDRNRRWCLDQHYMVHLKDKGRL